MDIIRNKNINVPIEQVYFYDTVNDNVKERENFIERDPLKRNRFWFNFPATWNTSDQHERIIGVRSFWIARRYRKIFFTMEINKINIQTQDETNLTLRVKSWWDYEKDMRELRLDFLGYLKREIEKHKNEWESAGKPIIALEDFHMDHIIISPGDNLKAETFDEYGTPYDLDEPNVNDKTYQQYCQIIYTTNTDDFVTVFKLTDFNDDAIACLNITDKQKEFFKNNWMSKMYFTDVWDRHSVLVSSSIAHNVNRNFLGFSGPRFTPIKYYKVNNDNKFWVDLYNAHVHEIPVNLPNDNKDGIVLEVVILHNAKELY